MINFASYNSPETLQLLLKNYDLITNYGSTSKIQGYAIAIQQVVVIILNAGTRKRLT